MEKEKEKEAPPVTLGEHRGLWLSDNKTIGFKPWKGLQEDEMSEMLRKNSHKLEGTKVCKKISLMLTYMCVNIAGHVFWEEGEPGVYAERMTQGERESIISGMYETDILTAFVLMRMACIDEEISMKMASPYKKDRFCRWSGNLSDLPFSGTPDSSVSTWEYKLDSPAMVRGKQVRSFLVGPSLWRTAELLEFDSPSGTNLSTIAGAIKGSPELDGEQGHKVTDFYTRDLYDVSKKDISRIGKLMEKNHSGLNMEIEVLDKEEGRDGRTFVTSVPWIYPDFFEDSSQ